jgi:hypothetical protein
VRARTILATLGLLTGLVLAACGGAGGAPEAATPGTDDTQEAQATAAPAAAPTSAPGGGGGTADACALLTVEEVTAATGQPGIEAQPGAEGETDALSTCGFVSNGVLPVVITAILDPANTNSDASSYLQLPMSVEVPVNGARAIFMPAAGYVMAVVKGENVSTIQVAMPAEGDDFQTAATRLVQLVADRMP